MYYPPADVIDNNATLKSNKVANQPELALEDPPLSNYFVGVMEGVVVEGAAQKVSVVLHHSLLLLLMFEMVVEVVVGLSGLSENLFARPLL